jgi:hypothetical protein
MAGRRDNAGFWIRFAAYIIDGFILAGLSEGSNRRSSNARSVEKKVEFLVEKPLPDHVASA